MSSEPSENAIDEFVAITNVSRDRAIAFLKANNLDSNRAINDYFENPNGPAPPVTTYQAQPWPEVTVTRAPEYDYQSQNYASTFDSSDNSRFAAAPSRPPSRIGARERNEGVNIAEAVEISAEQPPKKMHEMTAAEREDHEMRQAMAMSLSDNPDHFEQETGVIPVNGSKFGPANRDHYNEADWALSLPFATSREVCIDPDPEERKRVNGQPAFLRPADEPDYVAGLITIIHAVPLARETLLLRDRVAQDYGYNPQWWCGKPIVLPRDPTEADTSQTSMKDEIILETQRLMAFLDGTNRAFGSADSVANIRTVSGWGVEERISRFLKAWTSAALRDGNQEADIFSNRILKRLDPMEEEPIEEVFTAASITLGDGHAETLYDVMDTNLWADIPGTELKDIWLDRVADVFALSLNAAGDRVGIKIPSVWYPDRYLASCKDYAMELRKLRLKTDAEVRRLQKMVNKVSDGAGAAKGGPQFKELMEKTIAGTMVAFKNHDPPASPGDEEQPTPPMPSHLEHFATKLREIGEQVEAKLKTLEKRKEEALESLKQFSRQLTSPSTSPEEPPHRRYTLRGVCTRPHVVYVLKRREAEAEAANGAEDVEDWQWWRISFSVDDATSRLAEVHQHPAVPSSVDRPSSTGHEAKRRRVAVPSHMDVLGYTAVKVREVEVLRAAREESSLALLVYASDDAVRCKEEPLPPALQAFVDDDNRTFEHEILDVSRQQLDEDMDRGSTLANSSDSITQAPPEYSAEYPSLPAGEASGDIEMEDRGRPADRTTTGRADHSEHQQTVPGIVVDEPRPMVEMQERSGPGLLASSRHRLVRNPPSTSEPMQLIQEEAGSDTEGHGMEFAQLDNPPS